MTSFLPMEIKSSVDEASDAKRRRLLGRYRYHFGVLALALFLLLFVTSSSTTKKSNAVCQQQCSARRDQRYQHFKGKDILNPRDLLKLVSDQKDSLIEQLKVDYGEEHFTNIFMNKDGTPRPFVPVGDDSSELLKRKLMIKVLSAMKNLRQTESSFHGCDCIHGDVGIASPPAGVETKQASGDNNATSTFDSSFEKYVWATGGHSASAAHGNLYNESYTAFMERDLKDVFGSIGIDFYGRNYAMGGTGSAMEVSMCWTEIFGADVDFFSWDYGMTDAGEPYRLMHYAYRGSVSPGRPAFMGIRVNLDRYEQDKLIKHLAESGIPVHIEDNPSFSKMRKGIPDSFGLDQAALTAMPEYVRNFRCQDMYEKGEPYCETEKYTKELCEDRRGKAPWHPGIKTHAMVGHALSLFLIENLQSALKELIKIQPDSVEILLSRLKQQEEHLFDTEISRAGFENYANKLFYARDEENIESVDPTIFFTGNSMCHTARTPAETRYLGYLTNTDKVGGPAPIGSETYDVGVEDVDVPLDTEEMVLTWQQDEKRQADCPVAVSIDYKDSFMSQGGNWNTLVFPNDAERAAYGYDPQEQVKGYVLVAFRTCDWDRCEEKFVGHKEFDAEGTSWEMKVNGVAVEKLVDVGHKVHLLKGTNGFVFKPTENNDYKFEIKVNIPGKYVKVSSFIVV